MKKVIRNIINILDKPVLCHLLPPLAWGLAALKNRTPFGVFYHRDGTWIYRQRGGAVVDSKINFSSIKTFGETTPEIWGYAYEVKVGDTVIDVGAGIGHEIYYYSKAVGPKGKVVAIEAHPRTFACLKKFCELNHLENVIPLQIAIGDQAGHVFIDDRVDHVSNTIMGTASGNRIPMETLDTLIDRLGLERVDFLKMNIEGAERLAIRGMTSSVNRFKAICISCHDFIAEAGGSDDMRTR
ncbi:FkbM family methyltransferase, partial [Myxococcota bacterium]|nr:FkbM family methyltransferase [Myxococcota bacterium]